MSYTTAKELNKRKETQEEIIIQITKSQLLNFFRVILVLSFLFINYLAVELKSSLIVELFMAQAIVAVLFILKNSNLTK